MSAFVSIAVSAIMAAAMTMLPAPEAEEPSIYVGEFTVTAYCPCAECCGHWADGLTATGIQAGPGVVAVDPDVIKLGSTVIIDGQQYLAADTGSGVDGMHIDVCTDSHQEAAAFGKQTADVWVIDTTE